jgi:glycosyltransferase involved in cell wall biosynthesis
MKEDILLSVIIPVFNEEENIKLVYERLREGLKPFTDAYEVVFVDDGSSDKSYEILKSVRKSSRNVKVIRFSGNFGQHAAIRAGLSRSRGRTVVIMDADLQTDPEDIPRLMREKDKGFDIVCGHRAHRKDPVTKKFLSTVVLKVLNKLLGGEIFRNVSSLVAYDRKVVASLNLYSASSSFLTGWSCRLGYRASSVIVTHRRRICGKSKYNYRRLINLFLDVVAAFSERPLYILCFIGMTLAFVNVSFGVMFLVRKLILDQTLKGYTSVIVTFNALAGLEIFCIGLIGIYLAKAYRSLIGVPAYVIREVLDGEGGTYAKT